MEGNRGRSGRSGRRNDSISSVISVGADNTSSRSPQSEDDSTPATPRDTQRSSRAERPTQLPAGYHEGLGSDMDTSDTTDIDQSIDMMSDLEIRRALFELLDELPETTMDDYVTPYQRAALLPPVTQDSLGELDVGRIINNPKLRHDVNFDRELHFRPNLDGSRGRAKLESASEYWKALFAELVVYRAAGIRVMSSRSAEEMEYWTCLLQANQIRLPGIFNTIYEVLKTLVPERDQAIIAERLDVDMIMQQICKGVFNLSDLAEWLATVLKAHCAPMRDEWIEHMVESLNEGAATGDQSIVVKGLKQTLAILEAMKLDVANHQIRHLRSLLIDDTVNFQQKYHTLKINQGRMNIIRARNWFKQEETYLLGCNLAPTPLETFSTAVFRSLINQSPLTTFPDTFHLDYERLRAIRNDLYTIIQTTICFEAFDLLAEDRLDEKTREDAKKVLKANLADIIIEPRQYLPDVENISAEIVRLVLELEGSELKHDNDMMSIVESRLRTDLPASSAAFTNALQEILEVELPRLCNAVNMGSRLSLLTLHDTMLPPTQTLGNRATAAVVLEPPMDELLKRIAHLAVLHWHIWSPIVYDMQGESCLSRPGSSGNNPENPQMGANSAAPTSTVSTPELQSQGNGFTQPSGPSIINGRPQE